MLLPEPAKVSGMGRAREEPAVGREQRGDPAEERLALLGRYVLEDVEQRDEVERTVDRNVRERAGMEGRARHEVAREGDGGLAEVHPGHLPEPGQAARKDPGPAADVEDPEAARAVQEVGHDELELFVPEVRDEPVPQSDLEGEALVVLRRPRAGHDGERSAGPGDLRLRIALLTEWYPSPEHPAWGTFVAEHARALVTRHDVSVVVARPREALRAIAEIRRARPSLIHAHVFGPGAVALVAGRILRVPVVVSEHESRVARGLLTSFERRLARFVYAHADAVCPVSRDLATRIAELAPGSRIDVLPNPVDTELFQPTPPPVGEPVRALCVASLVPVKDVPLLLDALARVRARGRELMLDIAGEGPERAACEARARELGIDGVVRFLGLFSRDELAGALRASRFLCLSSRWENLPTAVLEALASGRPVVAPQVGGVPEAVGPGDGTLFPPGDADALAAALDGACDAEYDPEAIAARAAARFSFEAVAARATEIYAEALARR